MLAELGYNKEVPYPDISSKEKAQAFIGLDMEKLNSEKQEFINTVIPEWMKTADMREDGYDVVLLSD